MAQEYLPAPSNIRLADLMKEHNISQPELAKELGCSKSTISRFISGAKGTLTHEQVLKIARLFNVSTDFLLGETNIPDRKNYDIAELGLSVEAAKNLYTGRVNTEVVNLLLENARFAELTYRIAQYFDDTFASGIAAQNALLTTLSTLLRTRVKTQEAAKAAKDISLRRKPVYGRFFNLTGPYRTDTAPGSSQREHANPVEKASQLNVRHGPGCRVPSRQAPLPVWSPQCPAARQPQYHFLHPHIRQARWPSGGGGRTRSHSRHPHGDGR